MAAACRRRTAGGSNAGRLSVGIFSRCTNSASRVTYSAATAASGRRQPQDLTKFYSATMARAPTVRFPQPQYDRVGRDHGKSGSKHQPARSDARIEIEYRFKNTQRRDMKRDRDTGG